MNDADALRHLKDASPQIFIEIITLAVWAGQGCREHGLELAYSDDDVMVFRHVPAFSERLKTKAP